LCLVMVGEPPWGGSPDVCGLLDRPPLGDVPV